jgi:hypothetical protein
MPMRVVPIPDNEMLPGYTRTVFTGEADLVRVYPAEGLVGRNMFDQTLECRFKIRLDPEDLVAIKNGADTFHYVVKSLDVAPFAFTRMFINEEV